MKNVYTIQLSRPIKMDPQAHHFCGRETSHLYVVASSFAAALEAALRKYPGCEVRGISLMNYSGLPIVIGD